MATTSAATEHAAAEQAPAAVEAHTGESSAAAALMAGGPGFTQALSRLDRGRRAAVVRGLQRSAGNAVVSALLGSSGARSTLLQRQEDDVPALGEGDPVALDGEQPAATCPSGVSETFPTASEVPMSVTADSPSQWLNEVAAQLEGGVGHVAAAPTTLWCIAADGKSVEGVSVSVGLTKKVARPVRGHGLSGAANDEKWKVVQDMATSINEHENRHAAIYTTALKGIAQKMKDLKPAKGKKLTDADVQKVFDTAFCAAQKQQEDLDSKEGLIKVNPDEKGFTTSGATHDYTKGCASSSATTAKP